MYELNIKEGWTLIRYLETLLSKVALICLISPVFLTDLKTPEETFFQFIQLPKN